MMWMWSIFSVDFDECRMILFRKQCHEWWWLWERLSHIFTHTHELMNETSDNFMNISLLKSFTNGTWLNEWGGGDFLMDTSLLEEG